MDLAKREVVVASLLMVMVCLSGLSMAMAAVYNVGDSAGWTILGDGLDYQHWAAANQFFVGDSLFFLYNNQFHDVREVNVQDFKSCNPDNPIATYGSGADSINLGRSGNYFFLCGFPGHCQAGQKLHFTVNSAAANSPAAVSIPPPNANVNVATSLYTSKLACLAITVAALLPLL